MIAVIVAACIGYGNQSALATPVTTELAISVTSSGFPVGLRMWADATLFYGVNATGTMTFKLFAPDNPTCTGAPVLVSTISVAGNGRYTSGSLASIVAGTYRFTAAYSGDAGNSPDSTSCGDPNGAVVVAKRMPTFSTSATVLAGGTTTTDTAVLSGAGPSGPTGTMMFRVYGPNNSVCSGSPVFTSTTAVVGNGSYASPVYAAAVAGTYRWVVNYMGDANNTAAGSFCGDTPNAVNLTGGATAVSITAMPSTVPAGAVLTVSWAGIASPQPNDWFGLYKPFAADSAGWAYRTTTGASSGSAPLTVPAGASAGSYEIRLFAAGTYTRLDTSDVITVTA